MLLINEAGSEWDRLVLSLESPGTEIDKHSSLLLQRIPRCIQYVQENKQQSDAWKVTAVCGRVELGNENCPLLSDSECLSPSDILYIAFLTDSNLRVQLSFVTAKPDAVYNLHHTL